MEHAWWKGKPGEVSISKYFRFESNLPQVLLGRSRNNFRRLVARP